MHSLHCLVETLDLLANLRDSGNALMVRMLRELRTCFRLTSIQFVAKYEPCMTQREERTPMEGELSRLPIDLSIGCLFFVIALFRQGTNQNISELDRGSMGLKTNGASIWNSR